MASRSGNAIFVGVLLVVIGLLLLVVQSVPSLTPNPGIFPLALGIAFLGAYFYGRQYGFLVAGGILTGLGIGLALGSVIPGIAPVNGLGVGFLLIWVIDLITGRGRAGRYWPLVVGTILLVGGLSPVLLNMSIWRLLWPAILIIIGVAILARSFSGPYDPEARRRRREERRAARLHWRDERSGRGPQGAAIPSPPAELAPAATAPAASSAAPGSQAEPDAPARDASESH